jgi:hypothetical protein
VFTLANEGSTTERHVYRPAKRSASSAVLCGPCRPASRQPGMEQIGQDRASMRSGMWESQTHGSKWQYSGARGGCQKGRWGCSVRSSPTISPASPRMAVTRYTSQPSAAYLANVSPDAKGLVVGMGEKGHQGQTLRCHSSSPTIAAHFVIIRSMSRCSLINGPMGIIVLPSTESPWPCVSCQGHVVIPGARPY